MAAKSDEEWESLLRDITLENVDDRISNLRDRIRDDEGEIAALHVIRKALIAKSRIVKDSEARDEKLTEDERIAAGIARINGEGSIVNGEISRGRRQRNA